MSYRTVSYFRGHVVARGPTMSLKQAQQCQQALLQAKMGLFQAEAISATLALHWTVELEEVPSTHSQEAKERAIS